MEPQRRRGHVVVYIKYTPPLVSVNYGVLKRPPLSSNNTFTLHVKIERPFAHQGVSFRFGVLPLCILYYFILWWVPPDKSSSRIFCQHTHLFFFKKNKGGGAFFSPT